MQLIHIEQPGGGWRSAFLDQSSMRARYVDHEGDFDVSFVNEFEVQTPAGKTRFKNTIDIEKGKTVQFLWSVENEDETIDPPQWFDAFVTDHGPLETYRDIHLPVTLVLYTHTPCVEDMHTQSAIQFIDEHMAYDCVSEEIVPWRYQGSTYEPPVDDGDFLTSFTPAEFEDFLNTTVSKAFADNLVKYSDSFNKLSLEVQNNIGRKIIQGRDAVVQRLRSVAYVDEEGDIVIKDSEIRKAFQVELELESN